MSIIDGQRVNAATTNNAFVSRTTDSTKIGKLALNNPTSGGNIADTQQQINDNIADIADHETRLSQAEIDIQAIEDSVGQPNGIAPLDASSEVPYVNMKNAKKVASFVDDTAYETAHGSPTGGETYYNTTSGKMRQYNAIEMAWKNIGSLDELTWYQEDLSSSVNGSNTVFSIAYVPLTAQGILVFLDGVLVPPIDYSFSLPDITFNDAPALGQSVDVYYPSIGIPSTPVVPSAGSQVVYYHNVTAGEVTAEQITLPSTPSTPSHVLLDVIGGGPQYYGDDFSVSGSTLTFLGDLLAVIASGDKLRIVYFT